MRVGRGVGEHVASRLEANNIITNPQAFYDDPSFAAASGVLMGAQEMTRDGMKEHDFAELATLIAEIAGNDGGADDGRWKDKVKGMRARFLDMHYCF